MENRITDTELSRSLPDILARVRALNHSFIVEEGGKAIARIVPVPNSHGTTLREALDAWSNRGGSRPHLRRRPARGEPRRPPHGKPWQPTVGVIRLSPPAIGGR